ADQYAVFVNLRDYNTYHLPTTAAHVAATAVIIMPRTIPCRGCLNAMSLWDGQGAKPSSCENAEGRRKCSRCINDNDGVCAYATGDLKVRGYELIRILAEATERNDTVKEAQLVVYRLLRRGAADFRSLPQDKHAATVVHAAVAEPTVKAEPAVKVEPVAVKAEPASVKVELASVMAELASVKAELASVKAKLASVKAELASVKAEPVAIKVEPAEQ
ncbi:hypothetical protein F4680DRAFT_470091, partial [Xylaria scruposa]